MKSYQSEVFGVYQNQEIKRITLTNDKGFQFSVLSFGAIIQSIKLPPSFQKRELVLGFNDFESYISKTYRQNYPYFGAVIGRHAGRIKNGKTKILGKEINVTTNNGKHQLHGGLIGFDSKIWNIEAINDYSITLFLQDKDGSENYPGNLQVYVTYQLTEDNKIIIQYKATTDQPTLVNLTQHTYFNLNQEGKPVLEDEILVNASQYLEVDEEVIATGKILNTAHSDFDFKNFKKIPPYIDHSFIIDKDQNLAAILRNQDDSIRMQVETTQPVVHIYSGYYVPEFVLEDRIHTQANAGVCFETQGYLDADNHSEFPSNVLLPEEEYNYETIFSFKF